MKMSTDPNHCDESNTLASGEESIRGILNTTRTLTRHPSTTSNSKVPARPPSLRRSASETERDLYDVTGSTIVVTLLILSPPIVLVGVILLTTGAIISKIFVLVAGLATILSGVLIAATSAFVFVRMRGGVRSQTSVTSAKNGSSARGKNGGGGGSATSRGNYYRVTMDLERSTNSADGSFRVEITEQPTTMVTFFSSADSDTQSIHGTKTDGSNNSSLSNASGTIKAIGVKRGSENSSPC